MKNKIKFTLLSIFTFASSMSFSGPRNLNFPVEKNHVKIFAQAFDYQLIDQDRIQIGDLTIDATKVGLQLVENSSNPKKPYNFRFRWPSNLVKRGSFVLRDNVGKALWSTEFDLLKNTKTKTRNELALFSSESFDESLILRLQLSAYFKFCVQREDGDTRIFLCSKDLYVKKQSKSWSIISRDSLKKDSFVEINGKIVDPQGQIYLNSMDDTISMRAQMLSGASLEIGTRKKQVDFKDVVLSNDEKQLIIRAKGTEPVDGFPVKKFGADDWETSLSTERPMMYLKGEGDIPLRQEFIISGPVRKDDIQIRVLGTPEEQTYSSSSEIQIKKSKPDLVLSAENTQSELDPSERTWRLLDLEKGQINRRFLGVKAGENRYQAMADVERGYAFEASSQLSLPLYSASELQWWQDNQWTGLRFQYEKNLSKASTDPDWTKMSVVFDVRFPKGLRLKQKSWGLGLFYESVQAGSTLNLLGLHMFSEQDARRWNIPYFEWLMLDLKLPLSASSSDSFQMKTSYDLKANLRHFWTSEYFFEAGIRLLENKFENDTASLKLSKLMLTAGVGLRF